MKLSSLSIIVLLIASACDEGPSYKSDSHDYLPLEVGNYWKFKSSHSSEQFIFKRVTDKLYENNYQYYVVVTGHTTPDEVIDDTTYYRITSKGYVYIKRPGINKEENRFRLNTGNGDSWTYTDGEHYKVSIQATVETINLENTNLKNCKSFSYDIGQMADEEHTTTFAKEIGFVKEHSTAWGVSYELTSAIIHGKTITF